MATKSQNYAQNWLSMRYNIRHILKHNPLAAYNHVNFIVASHPIEVKEKKNVSLRKYFVFVLFLKEFGALVFRFCLNYFLSILFDGSTSSPLI